MRTLLFRSLKSSKISFHLFEDEFHNDLNFHKPTILDSKPSSLKCLSGSLIKHTGYRLTVYSGRKSASGGQCLE